MQPPPLIPITLTSGAPQLAVSTRTLQLAVSPATTGTRLAPVFPAPPSPFYLLFLHGNIRTCAGCHRPFPKKADKTFADPPFDVAICHEEERSFTHPETKERMKKFGNAYYHAYMACL